MGGTGAGAHNTEEIHRLPIHDKLKAMEKLRMSEFAELIQVIKENTQSAAELRAAMDLLKSANETAIERVVDSLDTHNTNSCRLAKEIENKVESQSGKTRSHLTIRLLLMAGILAIAFNAGIIIANNSMANQQATQQVK